MQYTSTRDKSIRVSAATAIAQGISEEGGLFVPCELPHFSLDSIGNGFDAIYRACKNSSQRIFDRLHGRRA